MVVKQLFRIAVMLVMTQMLYRTVTQQCTGGKSEKSVVGWMLQRHIYKTMLSELPLTCLFVCREDDRCQSFNWVFSRLLCEFNNRTKEARPEDFVPNPERSYFRRFKNRVSLGSIPELPAETCNEIKMSEGHAVSGKYWFSNIKTGTSVLAYCDMETNAFILKSCSEWKMLVPTATSGNYIIDPDDEGNLPAFRVYCNMTDLKGVTVISHDSESRTLVDGCERKGCYSRDIHYTGASLSQLASLTMVSSYCEQFISYECYGSMMLYEGYAWWVSRDSNKMTYWGGASPGSGKYACGMNKSCDNPSVGCNCAKNDGVWRNDSGFLSYKNHLPVKQLRFGDTTTNGHNEKGYHTLGKLRCYDIA